jgi:hypothetical protein
METCKENKKSPAKLPNQSLQRLRWLNITKKGDDHISNHKYLVEWNDINKTKSWVNYFTLSLRNSKPIISFERNNNLHLDLIFSYIGCLMLIRTFL